MKSASTFGPKAGAERGHERCETVIQLHGVGPHGVTYVNPADNPRKREREAGSSLRTQTQLQNAHCEEPALSSTSAGGGFGKGLRSCLIENAIPNTWLRQPLSCLWITEQPFEGSQQSASTEFAGNDAVHPTGSRNPGSAMEFVGSVDT